MYGVLRRSHIRAGEESVLDIVRCDGRAGAGPGCGPGDCPAGGGDYYGDGDVR